VPQWLGPLFPLRRELSGFSAARQNMIAFGGFPPKDAAESSPFLPRQVFRP
jgi:hypothetical protein